MTPEQFWTKVDTSGGPDACWPWTGYRWPNGYGGAYIRGRKDPLPAHRAALMLSGVEVNPGQDVCHRCDNRPCCNPRHLFVGSRSDNMRDAWAKGRGFKPPTLRGEKNAWSTLTDEQVIELRSLWRAGAKTLSLADRYGVSRDTIKRAANGRTYSHLPGAHQRSWYEARPNVKRRTGSA